jgi:excisionase family DNA binding protein
MSTRAASGEATTYLLEGRQLAEVVDFVAELARRGVTVPEPKPALVGADGRRLEVPEPVFEALVQVATAMAHGQGVTVIPQNALLTTQEAAELLGISRPTLVRLLEEGGIPFEQRGRHRRVMLADLLAYQGSMRRERREALDRMAQEGQAAGLYEATSGPPVRTRLSSLMARFPAFLDACTLYGAYLCDSLLRLAEAGTYRPLWSADVLGELERSLVARGLAEDAIKHRIGEMRRAFPDAEVHGYENIVETMTCDPKDRHVLAAAVRSDAAVLVTFNVDDFPDISTAGYDITVVHPDDFLLDQLDLYPGRTVAALRDQARSYSAPAMSIEDLLGRLAAAGVPKFAAEARRHLWPADPADT